MPSTLEDLDIAEVLAERHRETPIWNDLLAEYDADTVDEIGTGWPPILDTTFDVPAHGDNPGDEPSEEGQPEVTPNPPITEPEPKTEPEAPEGDPAPETGE